MTAAGARMCFRTMVFGCREASPLEARLLPMKGKVIVYKHHHTGNWSRTKPKFSGALLLPDPGRQWVAALYTMIISNSRETFAKKMLLSRTRKKTFARVSNITCTAFTIKTTYKDRRSPYEYILWSNSTIISYRLQYFLVKGFSSLFSFSFRQNFVRLFVGRFLWQNVLP